MEKEDVSFFSDALRTDDYSDFLCKLGLLRYILIGPQKGRVTDRINKRHSLGQYSKWFKGCNWESYFEYQNSKCVRNSIKDIISRRILGINHGLKESHSIIPKLEYRRTKILLIKEWIENLDLIPKNKVYYDEWINKWDSLLQNVKLCSHKLTKLLLREQAIVSGCKCMSDDIMFMPFYSHPKAVEDYIQYSTSDKESYNHSWYSKANEFLQKSEMERWEDIDIDDNFDDESFGDYVLLMSYKIAEIYNYVSGFLKNKELELLKWIIDRSNYKDVIRGGLSLIKLSENTFQNTCNDPIEDKYTYAIKKWKETNYPICNFQLTHPLNDEQLEKLFRGLNTYISYRSKIQSLRHILGGNHFEGYEPIIWEPKSKNKTPHKKSVLNLLVRLGIKWEQIEPKKLNYCFITLGKDEKWAPFNSNNIKDKGKKRADSTLDDMILDLLKDVFKDDPAHLTMMKTAKLVCDD